MTQAASRAIYTPIITAFGSLIKKYNMYPPGHAFVDQGLNQVMTSFAKYFESYPTLAIAIGSDRMYVEDQELGDDDMLGSFVRVLHQFGVTQIKFQRGLTRDDLACFFETFAVDSNTAAEAGGYRELLCGKGVTSIEIAVIDYRLREEHLDDVATASDAEIWQKLGNAWQGGAKKTATEDDQVFAKSLLGNVTRMAHALNSALDAKGKSGEAATAAETFLNMVASIAPEAAKSEAATRESLQRVIDAINPRGLYVLMKRIAIDADSPAARGGPAMADALARMPERKIARGLLKGFDAKTGTARELAAVYRAFVGPGREQAMLAEVRNLVFDSDNRTDPTLAKIVEDLAALTDPVIKRLQQTLSAAFGEQTAKETETYNFVGANRRDDPELLADFSAQRIQEAYCQNRLAMLEMARQTANYAFHARHLEAWVAGLIRDGQIELADVFTQTLAKHAAPENENAASRDTARELLKSLAQEELADAVIRAEKKWTKTDKAPLLRLLKKMGDAAFGPIVRALEMEENFGSRSFQLTVLDEAGLGAVEAIQERLAHGEWRNVRNMRDLLNKLKPESLIESLEVTVKHAEANVRKEAAKALLPAVGPRAVPLLATLIGDADEGVRHQAIINLGQFRSSGPAVDALMAALRQEKRFRGDAKAEELALRALGGMKDARALAALAPYVAGVKFYQQADKDLVAAAAKAMVHLGHDECLAVLRKGAKSWNRTVKQICAKCLAEVEFRTMAAAQPAEPPPAEAPQ